MKSGQRVSSFFWQKVRSAKPCQAVLAAHKVVRTSGGCTALRRFSFPQWVQLQLNKPTRVTLSVEIELENSAKLLPALLACHICTIHAAPMPCLWGSGEKGKDLVKGSRTLLRDMEELLYNDRLKGLALEKGEVWWDTAQKIAQKGWKAQNYNFFMA